MRGYGALAVDLCWVGATAILAVYLRDNFVPYNGHLEAVAAYAGISMAVAAVVFLIAGPHRALWQYTSLQEVLRLIAAATVALLIALFLSFGFSRLEGVARSIPVIQWLLLVTGMVGTRVLFRLWHERSRRDPTPLGDPTIRHVLVVGVSHVTELFLQSIAEYAEKDVEVVGILSDQKELHGRLMRFHKVLGSPAELPQVVRQLEVHGVQVDRIVVTEPFDQLSLEAQEALLSLERSSETKVDWIVETLGLREDRRAKAATTSEQSQTMFTASQSVETPERIAARYELTKRGFDVVAALLLSMFLAPLLLLVALVVAIDVGLPVVFWQKRPGRLGRPFKLYKFRTMRAAHNANGNRVADEDRLSLVGQLLRRSRLDELPQLYNVLLGDMSFVGPRPLLSQHQPVEAGARLVVRPGLTGLAQVHGGRIISPEDKNALDLWYVQNASLSLDVKILLRTPVVMVMGEKVDQAVLATARMALERLKRRNAAHIGSSPGPEGVTGKRQIALSG